MQKAKEYLKIFLNRYRNESFSQEGEDRVLSRFFENQKDGFYVEVGAHHPFRFSNTALFYVKGWKGLTIDPNPEVASLFKKFRSRDRHLQVGVGRENTPLKFYQFQESALNTFSDEVYKKRLSEGFKLARTLDVPVMSLKTVFEQNKDFLPKIINFMSVDVEGFDEEVLASNDWQLYRPQFVIVEIFSKDIEEVLQSKSYQIMKEAGYRLHGRCFWSCIFIDQKEQAKFL